MRVDIIIDGSGFYQIASQTKKGVTFCRAVQGYADGVAYCDDTRLTRDIADGAVAAGLRVVVNGTPYHGQG